MTDSGRALALAGTDEPTTSDDVIKVVKRFLLKSVGWVAIYLLGYYDFSVAWLITPLFLTVLRSQWKSERNFKLSAAREAALTDEKKMIESRIRVEDMPSWVFFPDKERAEWVNSIIQQLWPNVGHYVRKMIADSVEPAVKTALEGYGLGGFRFEKVVLGRVPPRITGIKVYDKNVGRDEIIMDLDLVFASDCDIKFCVKGLTVKVSDFSLRGLVRVVLKPLISEIPLIGGVQVYFLTSPEIDFDLGGVANALDAPGLSNIIRKIALEQLGYFMVLPNKFTMALAEQITTKDLKCPDSAGVLRVNLIRADKLMKKDIGILGMGKSDPYATLSVGAKKVQTKIINNTVSPEWFFTADFPIEVVKGQQLTIEVFDHDDPGDDEFLGRATVATSVVEERGDITNMWTELEDVASGKVLTSLSWLSASKDKSDLGVLEEGQVHCLIHVYVDSCHGLKSGATSNKLNSKPSPVVELQVGHGDTQTTWPQYHDSDPVFEQGFVFTVINPHSDDLQIRVLDSGHKNAVIGTATIRTSDLLATPNLEYQKQPFSLKGLKGSGGGATIILEANVRCLKKSTSGSKTATSGSKLSTSGSKSSISGSASKVTHKKAEIKKKIEDKPADNVPSLDKMVGSTIDSMVQSTGNKVDMDVFLNNETTLRQRTNLPESGNGKIKLSLSYNQDKEILMINVHEAKGLPGGDMPDPPDPYVKMYLLPERSKKSKRKSDAKKDTVTPIFDEEFEYDNLGASQLKSTKLEVSVVDKKGIFSRRATMGRTVIDLEKLTSEPIQRQWFDLTEVEEDSD